MYFIAVLYVVVIINKKYLGLYYCMYCIAVFFYEKKFLGF